MKFKNKHLSIIFSAFIAVLSLGSTSAYAEFSGSLGLASMYIFRGIDSSGSAPEISGGLNYDHSSGAHINMWTSSTNLDTGSFEQDIWLGYKGEVSGFGFDISLWEYLYPESAPKLFDTDSQELAISGSYMDATLTFVLNLDFDGSDDYKYVSADYDISKIGVGLHLGAAITGSNTDVDINASYAITDAAKVMISMAFGDGLTDAQKNPLVAFTYEIPFDLAKKEK